LNAAASRSPTLNVEPSDECEANAIPGCRTSRSGTGAGSAGTRSTRRSSDGIAYDGTTRRGSQTSIARVLSSTVSEPSLARIRFSVGS
jgi:hypothetical protein